MTWKKTLRKILKVTAWIIGSIIALLLLILILIQLPAVQNFAKNKIVSYLQDKLHTKVAIAKLSVDFPKRIVLENVYFEDQKKDTLLEGGKIRVDITLFKLLRNEVELNYIELDDIKTKINRLQPDTVFNYDYIIKAFASTPADSTEASASDEMKFKVGEIILKNVSVKFKDDVTGNDVFFFLGSFDTHIKTFDPYKSKYALPDINISGIRSSVRQYKPLIKPKPEAVAEAKSNEPINVDLELGNINFKNISFDYNNEVSAIKTDLSLGDLAIVADKIDLPTLTIQLKKIQLDNTGLNVALGKTQQAVIAKTEVKKRVKVEANNPWKIEVTSIDLSNNSLKYDDANKPKVAKGIDYNHLDLQQFFFNSVNLVITPTQYSGIINKLTLKEKSGLGVQQLTTKFFYDSTGAYAHDLKFKTNNSRIIARADAKYPSIDSITKNPALLFVDMSIDTFSVAAKEIISLVPSLKTYFKGNENAVIKLQGKAKGYINNINIPALSASGYGTTYVQLSGKIKGLPNAKRAYYDLQLQKLHTSQKDIQALLPAGTLPANINLPQTINASGIFKGTIQNFNSHIRTATDKGGADVTAAMSNGGKSYNIKAALDSVDLGYILNQQQNMGKVTTQISAKGTGFDYKTMDAVITAKLSAAELKGYNYTNLSLNATFKHGNAVADAVMDDPNIKFQLDADGDITKKYPALKMNLQLDTLNLNALHLIKDTMNLHGLITADMQSTNPDSLIGNITLAGIRFVTDTSSFTTDSVTIVAERKDNTESITLNSEAVSAVWKGDYKLTETGTAILHTIDQYYHLASFKDTAFTAQQWQMDIHVKPSSNLVQQFMPQLKGSDTVGAVIKFSSAANDLNVKINAPLIQYNEQKIEQLNVFASTNNKQLDYGITATKLGSKGFQLYKTSLLGNMANDKLFASLLLKDSKEKDRYHLALTANQSNNSYHFVLNPDSLLLNYEKWQVSTNNYIQYDSSGIIVNDFSISSKEQSLRLNSTSHSVTAPVEATFKNFRIKTLTEFAEQDSLLMDGTINGTATIKDAMKNPVFTSDLTVNDLSYKKDTIGNVMIKVDNQTANAFNADVKVTGKGNDVQLTGKYYTGESRMDLKLDINNIDLATITGLTAGQLKQAAGSLKGNIAIAGTTAKPSVNGNLHFSNATVTPTMLGSQFKLPDEQINITSSGINFNKFTLIDSAGNKAILNGDILTTDFTAYKFNLDFNAKNFMLVNSTQADNKTFYGKLNMDADVRIRGDLQTPSVKATLKANKSTDFTFVLPSDDPEIVSREGVVNFVDMDAPQDTVAIKHADSLAQYKALAGFDIDATIITDTAAAFTLVIDERNGDALKVKGEADLSGGIDESGKFTLTGNYQVEQGSYQVTLSILKKKFNIQSGSVITWKGDPMSADINITAMYEIKTASIDLVETQLTGRSETDINKFKQKIPVQVFLKMNGDLMKPVITFDIQLPKDIASQWREVDDKLAQIRTNESELNKQVFALLLLGRFTQEDPFETAGGSSNEALVRQSVSRLLTDQLNRLAGSLVKGVELNVGLNSDEDYSTGVAANRTDLTVGVSKSLLNDRLRVSVGSNFQLEGPTVPNQSTSNIAGDVGLEYQLTKDGRYRLRAYRVNKYEAVVEGQVVETGLTFIFTLDYDQFREIFNRSKKRKK